MAPAYEHYASTHGWDLRVVRELPETFVRGYSRPTWNVRLLCCNYRLYEPTEFSGYDLLALMDPDLLINPNAPCLSHYYDDIPSRGFAAVQVVSFAERRLFDSWNRYYYDDFLDAGEVDSLPLPEVHVNSGLVLVKPSDSKDDWLKLLEIDSDISDEARLNLALTQKGAAYLLPSKWNVVYRYELARRGVRDPRSTYRFARNLRHEFSVRFTHQRLVRRILPDVWALHFTGDKRIPMSLDVGGLVAAVRQRREVA